MAFIIENGTAGILEINDIGISLQIGETTDLSTRAVSQELAETAATGEELYNLIQAGSVIVKDPTDGVTNLSVSEAILAVQAINTPLSYTTLNLATAGQGSIDHTNLQNIGTNTHAQIDTHIGDGTIHYTKGSILLNDLGDVVVAGAKGDIIAHNGTNWVDVPVGTDGFALTADSGQASGLAWADLDPGPGQIASESVSFISAATVVIPSSNTYVDIPGATLDITTTETGYIESWANFNGLSPGDTELFNCRYVINGVNYDPIIMRLETANLRDNAISVRSATTFPAGTYTVKLQLANTVNNNNATVENFHMMANSMGVPAGPAGADGAAGPPGSGSTINVYEEGTIVPNSPFSELNFIGDAVTATDAGAGRTNITIDGGQVDFDRQGVQTLTSFSTTSLTDVDLTSTTLTTNDLGAVGDYLITFSCEYHAEKNDKPGIFSIDVGGSSVYSIRAVGVEDKGDNWLNFSMSHLEQNVASGTIIKMVVRTDNGDDLTIAQRELTIDGVLSSNVLP